MIFVMDASALLALLNDEPGADRVVQVVEDALISAVNWAEVMQKSLQKQVEVANMREYFTEAGVRFEPFTTEQAEIAAALWGQTREFGLSLADRACLALALDRKLPVLTADRTWRKLKPGVEIQLLR